MDNARVASQGGTVIFVSNVLSTLIAALGAVIIIRLLSPTEYGLYTIAGVPSSLMILFGDWGVNAALTRFIAKFRSEGKRESVASVLRAGLAFKMAVGAALAGLIFVSSDFLAQVVIQKPEAAVVVRASCLFVFGTQLYNTCWAAFMGLERMKLGALMQVLYYVSKVCIGLVLVLIGLREVGAMIGLGLGILIAAMMGAFILFLSDYLPLRKASSNGNWAMRETFATMVGYGFPLATLDIINGLSSQFFSFLNARYSSTISLGSYGVAATFMVLVGFITFPVGNVLFPTFSKLGRPDVRKQLEEAFKASVKYVSYLVIPASVAVIIMSQPMVSILFGEKYASAPLFLILLSFSGLLCGFGSLSMTPLLSSQGKTGLVLRIGLISTLATMPVSLFLIPSFGVAGFIASSLIVQMMIVVQGYYWIRKQFEFAASIKISVRIYLAAAAMGATIWITINLLNVLLGRHSPFLDLLAGSMIGLLSYIIFLPLTHAISLTDLNNLEKVFGSHRAVNTILRIVFRFMTVFQIVK